uniref:Uncharacterized protein MANES_05G207900 n=1 Tax=Rhizophora mucronata TaxID=61149 RepID=A0A2P2JWT1_RHIMU
MEMTGLSKVSLKPPNFSLCSGIRQRRTGSLLRCRTRSTVVKSMSTNNTAAIPIMVNSCNGQMGKAVIRAADSAGLQILPVSIGPAEESGNTVQVFGKKMQMLGPKDRESVLASLFNEHPNLIVVDFTVPAAVNDNADLYCKIGVPFVMGTTGGDRNQLYKTVEDSQVYAVISPQMGKPVSRIW